MYAYASTSSFCMDVRRMRRLYCQGYGFSSWRNVLHLLSAPDTQRGKQGRKTRRRSLLVPKASPRKSSASICLSVYLSIALYRSIGTESRPHSKGTRSCLHWNEIHTRSREDRRSYSALPDLNSFLCWCFLRLSE